VLVGGLYVLGGAMSKGKAAHRRELAAPEATPVLWRVVVRGTGEGVLVLARLWFDAREIGIAALRSEGATGSGGEDIGPDDLSAVQHRGPLGPYTERDLMPGARYWRRVEGPERFAPFVVPANGKVSRLAEKHRKRRR